MQKEFRVIVAEGHSLTVRREMLPGGTWEITAVRSDGQKVSVDDALHSLTGEALERMIEVATDFIRTESR